MISPKSEDYLQGQKMDEQTKLVATQYDKDNYVLHCDALCV